VDLHSSPTIGHSSFHKIYEQVKKSFVWDTMNNIPTFLVEYDTYQRNKVETMKIPMVFQTLLIHTTIWDDISMDFMIRIPKEGNHSIIMVVVNLLSIYAHLCALRHLFNHS
jgi:hypothetical protein